MRVVFGFWVAMSIVNSWAEGIGSLRLSTSLDEKLETFEVSLQNSGAKDLFCPELVFEAVYFDTETYVDVSTHQFPLVDRYFRKKGESQSQTFRLGEGTLAQVRATYPAAILKSARFVAELSECHPANFEEFAEHAELSSEEQRSIEILRRSFGMKYPSEIQDELSKVKTLGLQGKQLRSLKPIEFFESLEVLDISKNPLSDLSPLRYLEALRKLDISETAVRTLKPLMPRKDQLRVRARSVRLAKPEEVNEFRKAHLIVTFR